MRTKIEENLPKLDKTFYDTKGKFLSDPDDPERKLVGALAISDKGLDMINEVLMKSLNVCFKKNGNNFLLSVPKVGDEEPISQNNEWFEVIDSGNITEFTNTGLVLFINQILQPFGFSLTYTWDEVNKVASNLQIGKTRYRGFSEESISRAYRKLGNYLAENAVRLNEESKDKE